MKKILLILLLLSGLSIYSQETNSEKAKKEKAELEKKLTEELKKTTPDKPDQKIVDDLIKKISVLNNKSNVLTVVYDFETQTYITNQLKPKHKQPIVLQINNINKIANKVEITSNDVKIKDDFLDGDEKKAASLIAEDKPKEEIKKEALNVNLGVLKNIGDKIQGEQNDNQKKKYNTLKTELEGVNLDILKKNIDIEKNSVLVEKKNNQVIDLERKKEIEINKDGNIVDITAKYKNLIDPIQDEIKKLNDSIEAGKIYLLEKIITKNEKESELITLSNDLGKFNIKTISLLSKYNCIYKKIKDINRINSAYNNFIDYVINPSLTHDQYRDDSEGICAILKADRIGSYYSDISIFDETYADFIQEYNLFYNDELFYKIKDFGEIGETYAKLVKTQIETLKRDVEALYLLVDVTGLRKKLNNVEIINNVLSKEKAFIIVSNPVQPLEDYIEFKVKVKQNNELGSSIIKENDKDFTYIEYVRQGVRWDVSVGPVFDFGIKNQEYEIKKVTDSKFQIVENNSSKYKPTIAAMLHTSFRSNSMFAFGLSLGVSINVVDLNFNSFFPGVSVLIGKREKMVFTIGPAFKRVNQIKSIYENDADRTLAAEIQKDAITSEQFRIGYFFGITYNLTSKQVSKIKKI